MKPANDGADDGEEFENGDEMSAAGAQDSTWHELRAEAPEASDAPSAA